ncbi:MAG: hypothetical protein UFJ18_10925 [Blautia sp.]|nr:hypothetical protein [Blautia sp.]
MRYTEYHDGVAVIKDKALLKEAMAKLAKYEDVEDKSKAINATVENMSRKDMIERLYIYCKQQTSCENVSSEVRIVSSGECVK